MYSENLKKEIHRKRDVQVSIRMSTEEKEKFDRLVAASGLSQADYFIHCALRKKIIVVGTKEQLDRLIYEVNHLGVNLNQIAKRMNQGSYYPMRYEWKEIRQQFTQVLDAVMKLLDKQKTE